MANATATRSGAVSSTMSPSILIIRISRARVHSFQRDFRGNLGAAGLVRQHPLHGAGLAAIRGAPQPGRSKAAHASTDAHLPPADEASTAETKAAFVQGRPRVPMIQPLEQAQPLLR